MNDSTKGISSFCSAKSPIDLSSFELCQESVSSQCPSSSALKQSRKMYLSNSLSSSALEKYVPSNSFSSNGIHSPPKTTPSRSSMFCTNLYLSSSSISEVHSHLGNFPFLPNPSTPRPTPSTHLDDGQDVLLEDKQSEDLITDFLSYPGNASDGGLDEVTCEGDSLDLTEQMELQLLSDELNLAMTDSAETPGINEIYEATPAACLPGLPSEKNHSKTGPPSIGVRNTPETSATLKPRMRWTSELHQLFLEAVKKLDGAEKATPKGVLKLMNVEEITIYHVKSHLQKYRLAKYMPERMEEKREEDKKAHSSSKESDALKKGSITEALRMQMEVQKQLHEQLEVQRTLQLRIEEHARYLQKMFEEQQKAGISLFSTQSSSSITTQQPTTPMGPVSESKHDSSSPMASTHQDDGNVNVDEQPCQKKARIESKAKSESPSDVCDDGSL